MRYVVYGINRVAKDFMYIFRDLDVTYVIADKPERKYFENREVYDIEEFVEKKRKEEIIIICDFDKEQKEEKLKRLKMSYGKDYLYEEDFFSFLDMKKFNPYNKKIVVWGTGLQARRFMEWISDESVEFFLDTYKYGMKFYGKEVKSPEDNIEWENYYIIVAVARDYEICEFLRNKKINDYDFCNAYEYMTKPSALLKKTIFDPSYYDLNCDTMKNHCEVKRGGKLTCCCSTFVDEQMGSLEEQSFDNIWKGIVHRILVLSVVNKTYTFCKKDMCPFFFDKKADEKVMLEDVYSEMEEYPKVLSVGMDASCNLNCITCRKLLHIASGEEKKANDRIAEYINYNILPHCEFMIIAGSGEVFASSSYKKIYTSKNASNLKQLRILSNGLLFNEKTWKEFKEGKTGKIMLTVSVDAATKDTYEKIRRGGKFEVLKKNMEYASLLRKNNELSYFRLNFVVQRENYLEMIPFVEWGLELGVDEIFFTKILNWGTYTEEEFELISMMEKDGVTPKKELQNILDHPLMSNKIVDLGTINYSKTVIKKNIYNYYMWELERKVDNLFE